VFLKSIYKRHKATGEFRATYRLCESYRFGDTVRHHTIVHLGALEDLPGIEPKQALCHRIESLVKESRTGIRDLFVHQNEKIESLAQKHFAAIVEKDRLDIAQGKDYHRIDTDSVENKSIREVGAEWLCMQAIRQLNMAEFLVQKDWPQESIQLALTHIISRAVYPASELRTSKWIKQNSSVCELTGYLEDKITKDKLYGISHRLYTVKDELEKHLSTRTNELFDLDDKIIIYDLTNTYFEGRMQVSKIAAYGKSKEKRSDAKLVVLAVVVNAEGFLKYSQIFEGNIADCKTLVKIIKELSERTSVTGRKPVIVLDAGIATEDNLQLLEENGFDYICVSRAHMKKYSVAPGSNPIRILDNKKQPITLQKVRVDKSDSNYLLVHSTSKEKKEVSMNYRFAERFEQGLKQIKESLGKKSGVKKQEKVWERIGRLKAKYPSIHKYYNMEVIANKNGICTGITWQQKPAEKREGRYLLRTNLNEKDEHTQWTIYNTIREIEATFRVLKTDLDLRPIYHKKDDAAMAHLHLGLLAYWVVNTIRYQLKQKGINNEWRDLVRIMNTQKIVTTAMTDEYRQQIIIRQCSEPSQEVKAIYAALDFKPKPFTRKKSVVPPNELKNAETYAQPYLSSA
jgi:hypothetical protein